MAENNTTDISINLSLDLKAENNEYKSPVNGKFPLIANLPLPGLLYDKIDRDSPSLFTGLAPYFESVMQSVNDCGCNVIITGGNLTQMDMALDAIAKKGLDIKVILNPTWLRQSVAKSLYILNRYMGNSLVGAWKIMNEPKYYSWGDILYLLNNSDKGLSVPTGMWEWNDLTTGMDTVRSVDVSRMCYFNLAATGIKDFVGGTEDYAQYLEVLQTFYKLPVWSYDFYPFVTSDTSNPTATYYGSPDDRYDEFFHWLDVFCENSKNTGRPFWAYCMCQGHIVGNMLMPAPTLGMLRFEAFNALAMGAQGIVYWRYGQSNLAGRYSAALDCEESPSGSGNLKFTRTDIWNSIKQVNDEILKYSWVFLGCEVISAMRIPVKSTGNYKTSFPIGCVENLSGGTKGFLITNIKKSGTNYMVIVNSDPFNSVSYQVRIKNNTSGSFHTGDTSSFKYSSSSTISQRTITRQLESGDMDIIEWH